MPPPPLGTITASWHLKQAPTGFGFEEADVCAWAAASHLGLESSMVSTSTPAVDVPKPALRPGLGNGGGGRGWWDLCSSRAQTAGMGVQIWVRDPLSLSD